MQNLKIGTRWRFVNDYHDLIAEIVSEPEADPNWANHCKVQILQIIRGSHLVGSKFLWNMSSSWEYLPGQER
jgi:hypothetical protein